MATIFMARMLMVRLSMRLVLSNETEEFIRFVFLFVFFLLLCLSFLRHRLPVGVVVVVLSCPLCLLVLLCQSLFFTLLYFRCFASFPDICSISRTGHQYSVFSQRPEIMRWIWGFPTHTAFQLINKSWLWNKWQVAISTGYMTRDFSLFHFSCILLFAAVAVWLMRLSFFRVRIDNDDDDDDI